MKRRLAGSLAAMLLAAVSLGAPPGVDAQTAPGTQAYSAYSTGTVIHADALQAAVEGPRLVDAEVAFSGASNNSQGLATTVNNEMSQAVQPAKADKKAYGRGSGLELGLGTTTPNNPNANQLILAAMAESSAPPVGPLVTEEVGPVPADPVAYASLLRGQAATVWDDRVCSIGQPIAYGLGYAADAQLLNTGAANGDGSMRAPVVAADTGTTSTVRAVSQSKSFTYLKPNGDGTWGIVSETRQTIAPVTLFKGTPNEVTIEALGEWVLRATTSGKAGGAKVEYAPGGPVTPTTPLLRIIQPSGANPVTTILTTQDIFGETGLVIPANPLVSIAVGEDPRAIAAPGAVPDPESSPAVAADGTSAAGAVDVVRINLLQPDATGGLHALDLRIGHMEAKATAPAGGIRCEIPVSKTASPDPVQPGQPFTWTISIPTSPEAFAPIACDLVDIRAVDTVRVVRGTPRWRIDGASDGGVVTGNNRVEWSSLGTYKRGDPPKRLTINGTVLPDSGEGLLENTVNVTATLANCTGGAVGQDIVTQITQITGTGQTGTGAGASGRVNQPISGTGVVSGPTAQRPGVLAGGELPATGTDAPLGLLATAAGLVAAAAWAVRRWGLTA